MKKLAVMRALIEQLQIPCEYVLSKRKFSLGLLRRLNRIAKADNYDLIHVHLIQAEFWFAVIKRWMNKSLKLVSTIHGFDEKFQSIHGFDPTKVRNSLYVRILKFNQPHVHSYIAVSKSLKTLMVDSGIIPPEKIRVVYYGARAGAEPVAGREVPNTVLVPGRLVRYKGQDLLIDAAKIVIEKVKGAKFILAGDFQGEFGHQLQQKVRDLGLSESIVFPGHVSNLAELYHSSSLVVLPSRSEGFGLVMMEAFNAEKAVVAFDVPAFNEVIENGKSGILCPPFDISILADQIISLLTDKEKRIALAREGRKKLLSDFSLERMVAETVEFYRTATEVK
jgi:glycosyltransferase involved in cell wall biosynthesis